MHDASFPAPPSAWATMDSHDGKVSKRVEVLRHATPPATDDGRYDGMVAVVGEHPTGALDERPLSGSGALVRGASSVGWVDPAVLRDWYHPDLVVVTVADARAGGLEPGVFAETRSRGRVRIAAREGHIAPDGRPAFRALAGPAEAPVLDAPLPRDEVVRIVEVIPDVRTSTGAGGVAISTTPVSPVLAPGPVPDHRADRPGAAPTPAAGTLHARAFLVTQGERHEILAVDEPANTMWIARADGSTAPIAVSGVAPDLVRYTTEPHG